MTTKEKDALVHKLPAEVFPDYFLIRVNEFNQSAVTPLEEWVEYLKTGCIREDTKAPGLREAREKLIYYSMSKEEQRAYDEHLSAIMIQNDVLDGAKLEGRMEERLEVARNMKNLGVPVDIIIPSTRLSKEEIDSL